MRLKLLLHAVAATCLSISATAQSAPANGIPLVVTNAPFTGQEWTTVSIAHSDGSTTQIARRIDITRNTAGSTRRELRILSSSDPAVAPTRSLYADVHDVPNRLVVHLDPTSSVATVGKLPWSKPYTITQSLPIGAIVAAPAQNLGLQSIVGFTATGSRQTLLYPKGTKDPNQDVTQTIDTWYSPDLQVILLTQTLDSLNNSTNTSITQVVRGEPDPTLFTVPQNYTTTIASKSATGK